MQKTWLCFSPKLNQCYCQPCWLFSSIENKMSLGFDDWSHLSKAINSREVSKAHIEHVKFTSSESSMELYMK
jgi:hypothetical protein